MSEFPIEYHDDLSTPVETTTGIDRMQELAKLLLRSLTLVSSLVASDAYADTGAVRFRVPFFRKVSEV